MTRIAAVMVLIVVSGSAAFGQDVVSAGKTVYAAQKCSVCHSIAGAGNKKGELDKVGAKLSAEDVRSWITSAPEMAAKAKAERKPAMKAYMLAKDDLEALVAYLQTLK